MNTSLAPKFYPLSSGPVARPLAPPAAARPLKPAHVAGRTTAVPSFAEVLEGVANTAARRQAAAPAAAAAASAASSAPGPERLAQAAREMEGVFLNLLWKEAWNTAGGAFFPAGLAGDIYKDFLTEALSDRMAEAGGIGLANLIQGSQAQAAPAKGH
ncbi:MAG: rod-binding protein [Chitinophagales bacterium]